MTISSIGLPIFGIEFHRTYDNFDLRQCSKWQLRVICAESDEFKMAGLDRLKIDRLAFVVVLEFALGHRLAPFLAIDAGIKRIFLDAAIGHVLAWQEPAPSNHGQGVQPDHQLVREFWRIAFPRRMPAGLGIAIDDILCRITGGFAVGADTVFYLVLWLDDFGKCGRVEGLLRAKAAEFM